MSLNIRLALLAGALALGFGGGVWVTKAFWQASVTRQLKQDNEKLRADLQRQKELGRRGVSLTLAMASVLADASRDWARAVSDLAAGEAAQSRELEEIIHAMEQDARRSGDVQRVPGWLCRAEADAWGRHDLSCPSE